MKRDKTVLLSLNEYEKQRLVNTVAALRDCGEITEEGRAMSVQSFLRRAMRREIDAVERMVNGGRRFPQGAVSPGRPREV